MESQARAGIDRKIARYVKSVNRGEPDVDHLYADDAKVLPPHLPVLVGKQAIAPGPCRLHPTDARSRRTRARTSASGAGTRAGRGR